MLFLLKVTGDHTESQILLGLELYKQRYDYVYELLFSLANFHSPVVKNERALEVHISNLYVLQLVIHNYVVNNFVAQKFCYSTVSGKSFTGLNFHSFREV